MTVFQGEGFSRRRQAEWPGRPIGVFGEMSALKVKGDLRAGGARVFARDLVGGMWHDITGELAYADGETVLPGDVLAKIGREAATADVYSSPGTLVAIR